MLPELCLLMCAAIWCYIDLVPTEDLILEWYTLIQISLLFVLLACLGFVWKIKNRLIAKGMLFILIGFTVWVILTNNKFDYSKALACGETVIMLIALLLAVLLPSLRSKHNAKS